ncbi:hypothetical protein DFR49_0746 [Hephaestia caeni]|uniref:Uncharacterized protein n=1 Tax=Hephaestia caeni TaxID=645617 RepID=A0A397PCS7_9SPHN|nr:hypothetical protein [Hephaestia caeni]RIA46213.1 hypothetical protein DFR49_0746 [Hephaestia caeni]
MNKDANTAATQGSPAVKPVCAHCGGDRIVRDASVHWKRSTSEWALDDTQEPNFFCDTCNVEGIDIVQWIAVDPEAELPVMIGARVRIRDRRLIGGDRFKDREGIVVRENSLEGFYVNLDMTPRERVKKVELVMPRHLEVLWLSEPPQP